MLQVQCLDGFGRQAAFQNFLRYQAEMEGVQNEEYFRAHCIPEDVSIPVFLSKSEGDVAYARGIPSDNTETCRRVSDWRSNIVGSTLTMSAQTILSFLRDTNVSPMNFELDENYRIYATENFYYFNEYVAQANMSLFTTEEFINRAKKVCETASVTDIRKLVHKEISEEKLPSACFGLIFLSEFLSNIVSIKPNQLLKAVTAVRNRL